MYNPLFKDVLSNPAILPISLLDQPKAPFHQCFKFLQITLCWPTFQPSSLPYLSNPQQIIPLLLLPFNPLSIYTPPLDPPPSDPPSLLILTKETTLCLLIFLPFVCQFNIHLFSSCIFS